MTADGGARLTELPYADGDLCLCCWLRCRKTEFHGWPCSMGLRSWALQHERDRPGELLADGPADGRQD